jgi:hypothetical protein
MNRCSTSSEELRTSLQLLFTGVPRAKIDAILLDSGGGTRQNHSPADSSLFPKNTTSQHALCPPSRCPLSRSLDFDLAVALLSSMTAATTPVVASPPAISPREFGQVPRSQAAPFRSPDAPAAADKNAPLFWSPVSPERTAPLERAASTALLCDIFPAISSDTVARALERSHGDLDMAIALLIQDSNPPNAAMQSSKGNAGRNSGRANKQFQVGAGSWRALGSSMPSGQRLCPAVGSSTISSSLGRNVTFENIDYVACMVDDEAFARSLAVHDEHDDITLAQALQVEEESNSALHASQHSLAPAWQGRAAGPFSSTTLRSGASTGSKYSSHSSNRVAGTASHDPDSASSADDLSFAARLKVAALGNLYPDIDRALLSSILEINQTELAATLNSMRDLFPQYEHPHEALSDWSVVDFGPTAGAAYERLLMSAASSSLGAGDAASASAAAPSRDLPEMNDNIDAVIDAMLRKQPVRLPVSAEFADFRTEAAHFAGRRDECFVSAARAGGGGGAHLHAMRGEIASRGQDLNQKMHAAHAKAAIEIFHQQNASNDISRRIDLHGLFVKVC